MCVCVCGWVGARERERDRDQSSSFVVVVCLVAISNCDALFGRRTITRKQQPSARMASLCREGRNVQVQHLRDTGSNVTGKAEG